MNKEENQDSMNNMPLILLVDDVPQNIQILHQILNMGEYSFAIATSGKEALQMVKKKLPDLILLDIMLGDIDGFEVCQRLKKDPETAPVPIIFLTAKVGVEDKVKGFKLGAVDYITKPFEDAEVVARVHTHIQLKKSIDIIKEYNQHLKEAFGEMQKSYQEIMDSQEKLLEREKKNAVKALSATATHEMNQPITVIQGYLDMFIESLDMGSLNDMQKKYLNRIQEGLNKLIAIIARFTKYSHIYLTNESSDKLLSGDDKPEKVTPK
ncbi:MAG: response regulator [Candidatus Aminicenantes bacterium]|jgi:CheY-like chemotaxis protein